MFRRLGGDIYGKVFKLVNQRFGLRFPGFGGTGCMVMSTTRSGARSLEAAVQELFDSQAECRVYVFLLRHDGVLSDEVIRGTGLHPSTVRELLASMYGRRVVVRRKLRTDSIGKNPFLYFAVSPLVLVRRRAKVLERRLNALASCESGSGVHRVSIWIHREDAS